MLLYFIGFCFHDHKTPVSIFGWVMDCIDSLTNQIESDSYSTYMNALTPIKCAAQIFKQTCAACFVRRLTHRSHEVITQFAKMQLSKTERQVEEKPALILQCDAFCVCDTRRLVVCAPEHCFFYKYNFMLLTWSVCNSMAGIIYLTYLPLVMYQLHLHLLTNECEFVCGCGCAACNHKAVIHALFEDVIFRVQILCAFL